MGLSITRATKVVPLVTDMGLQAEHERAVMALDDAKNAAAQDPRETSTAVREAAEAVQAIERTMREHTVLFTLQAVPRKVWNEHEAAHAPRQGNQTDEAVGIDTSTLDPIIARSIIAVTTRDGEPVPFAPATDWEPLADEMSDAQYTAFVLATLGLNNGATSAPFSPAASLAILRSEQTSKRPSA